jgi:beta propeller repeat protein
MENKNKLHSAALASVGVILFLIIVSSTASASISETRITTSGKANNPAIYGNNIVWQDTRNGNSAIYSFDLSTKKETHITDKSDQKEPAIYGNKVVYVRNETDICMYDLSAKKVTTIDSSLPEFPVLDPAIYGNLITWEFDQPDSIDAKICYYDLSTRENGFFGGLSSNWGSSIFNKRIVWTSGDTGNNNVVMHDFSTSQDTLISQSGKADTSDIYGDKIVWQDKRNGNWDIYMYDLSTKKETQITTNSADSINPVIYGNNIVWQDNRNGNWQIYAYDLITHQQIHTTDKSDQVMPAIYNNKIMWTDYRSGKPNIYMGTISYLPVASFTASPTTGKHPLSARCGIT